MRTRKTVYRYSDLKRTFAPRSVAIVGASPDQASLAWPVMDNFKLFQGDVYYVNPKYKEIDGRPCYPSIKALPATPDMAVLTIGRNFVEPVVIECAERNVGGVVIFAAGYAESGMPERKAMQERLVQIATEADMRILGPNCVGYTNYILQMAPNFSRNMDLSKPNGPHAIAIASQSGGMGTAIGQAAKVGVAVSHMIATGNASDVDVADVIAYLAMEPSCTAIVTIFEGIRSPERLMQAAEIAKANNKPLLVHKVAIGEKGAIAAASHTGALAGSMAAFRAAFDRMEAIEVPDFEGIAETAAFFAKAPRPKGPGVGVVAGSGGLAVLSVDLADAEGVPLPMPNEAVISDLRSKLPDFAVVGNPCDVSGGNTPNIFSEIADAFLSDPEFGAVVMPYIYTFESEARLRRVLGLHDAAKKHGKISCVTWSTGWLGGPGMKESHASSHLAVFTRSERCFKALAAWHRRDEQIRNRPTSLAARLSKPGSAAEAASLIAASPNQTIAENAAKKILSVYGIDTVPEDLVNSVDEALAACRKTGFPVVMKVDSPQIPHKTEAGVVRLFVQDEAAACIAYAEIVANAKKAVADVKINGVVVQPMLKGGVELMMGTKLDPVFGPIVLVGLGGIFVELLKDVAVELAPVNHRQALAMLNRLKGRALLDGFRGGAAVDLDAVARTICRVSEFAVDHKDSVAELDINPFVCKGDSVVAVDALIVCRNARH